MKNQTDKLIKQLLSLALVSIFCITQVLQVFAQQKISFTFEQAAEYAFDVSYEIYKRRMDYQKNSLNKQADQAGLRSFSTLNVDLPSLNQAITRIYNSSTESFITKETDRTQFKANWDITQPIVFPFITNGTISIKSNLESLDQIGKNRSYKNRLFMELEQPLFTRNQKKKEIWRADLEFEKTEANSISSILTHYQSLNRLFYDLYRKTEEFKIDSLIVDINYSAFQEASQQFLEGRIDSIDVIRLEVDYLLNRSELLSKKVELFKKELEFKQKFGLSFDQPVELIADLSVKEIEIDVEKAVAIGLKDRPSLRSSQIDVEFRKDDIESAGSNAGHRLKEFSAELRATYGFENSTNPVLNEKFSDMFTDYNVTRSIELEISFPLWDNGRKEFEIEAAKLNYENAVLKYENDLLSRENDIRKAARDYISSQQRVIRQEQNIALAKEFYDQSLESFRTNDITAQELSRAVDDYRNAQNLYLGAFISYKTNWINFQQKTYWDWDKNISLKEKFRNYLRSR
ncbi:TolC family protein [candidate division KSB1 bacterium]|nr:TolC family protein [candidate division KSB1 bacterium]